MPGIPALPLHTARCLADPSQDMMPSMLMRFLFAAVLLLIPTAASGTVISGQASVIDGDTLEIHGERIRMFGIDAPESDQTCLDAKKKSYRCGQWAALALSNRIGRHVVSCIGSDYDVHGRLLAVCSVSEENLSAWMVRNGWAMAYVKYSSSYVGQEVLARTEALGIWSGEFVPPWDWRRSGRLVVPKISAESGSCVIKGNISTRSGERIYHLPEGRWYDKTVIDTQKGERWFCSEAEARSAGWRASKQ